MVNQVAELDRFGWTTFYVMERKPPSLIVGCHTAGATPTVATQQTSGYHAVLTSTTVLLIVSIITNSLPDLILVFTRATLC